MAPAGMWPRPAQVPENVSVGASALFQGVGQDGESLNFERPGRQNATVVGRLCQGQHGGNTPGGVEGEGTEGVAEEVAHEGRFPPLGDSPVYECAVATPGVGQGRNQRRRQNGLPKHPPSRYREQGCRQHSRHRRQPRGWLLRRVPGQQTTPLLSPSHLRSAPPSRWPARCARPGAGPRRGGTKRNRADVACGCSPYPGETEPSPPGRHKQAIPTRPSLHSPLLRPRQRKRSRVACPGPTWVGGEDRRHGAKRTQC